MGSNAQFQGPGYGMACDATGIVSGDYTGHRLRRISYGGFVTTIAGSSSSAASVNGPALSTATFTATGPAGASVDAQGNIYIGDPGACRIQKYSPPAKPFVTATAPVCGDGVWHHVALTLSSLNSGSVATLFVDGTQAAQLSYVAPNTAQGAPTALGVGGTLGASGPAGAEPFSGLISDVRAFGRALSAQEVASLARPPLPSFNNSVLSPNPTTVNGTNSVFVYTCAFGFIGPAVTVQRSAVDGTWSSAGGAVSCVTCSASQFSLGGTQCIDIPVLTPLTPPNVVVAPPVAAAGVLNYVFSCAQPGFSGATQNYSSVATPGLRAAAPALAAPFY